MQTASVENLQDRRDAPRSPSFFSPCSPSFFPPCSPSFFSPCSPSFFAPCSPSFFAAFFSPCSPSFFPPFFATFFVPFRECFRSSDLQEGLLFLAKVVFFGSLPESFVRSLVEALSLRLIHDVLQDSFGANTPNNRRNNLARRGSCSSKAWIAFNAIPMVLFDPAPRPWAATTRTANSGNARTVAQSTVRGIFEGPITRGWNTNPPRPKWNDWIHHDSTRAERVTTTRLAGHRNLSPVPLR